MNMIKNAKKILFSAMITALLAGCGGVSNGEKQARTYEKRHPITIEKTQNTIEIPISTAGYVTQESEAKIKSFLYTYDNYGKSNLVITAPETGGGAGTTRTALKHIIEIAQEVGIKKGSIKLGTYQALDSSNAVIRMNFEALVAKASDCSDRWSENLTDAKNNELSKGHGCAMRKNLVAMIADPEDLVRMRRMGAGNAARRVGVFDKYTLGESTAAALDAVASSTDQ
jgi:pilus assembly protein CpaD